MNVTTGITLALDAATAIGTVAVIRDGSVVANGETRLKGEAGERLLPLIDDVLRDARIGVQDVERVVCGAGPGSFTSLRIAASAAKGIAMARAIPLFAIGSLDLIVLGARSSLDDGRYLAALDAMRGEFFVAEVNLEGGNVDVSDVALVSRDALDIRARETGASIVGPGQAIDVVPHARGAVNAARWRDVDIDTWEPSYGRLAEAQAKWEAQHGRKLV